MYCDRTDLVSADPLLYNKVLKAYITRSNADPEQTERVSAPSTHQFVVCWSSPTPLLHDRVQSVAKKE